jgi:hypothetical protein
MMKKLLKNNCPMDAHAFYAAAMYCNLKMMKWLKKHNCPWWTESFGQVALNGSKKQLPVRWLDIYKC